MREHRLDGDEDGHVVGVAEQVVVQPSDPRRAGDAAEAEERDPFDVLAQPDDPGDPGVEGRDGEPGDRGGDDEVDVGGREAGGLEGVLEGRRPERHRVLEEEVVGLVEAGEALVVTEREDEVTLCHTGIAVDRAQQTLAHRPACADDPGERVGDLTLVMAVGGESRPDGQQAGAHGEPRFGPGVIDTVIGPRGPRRP